MDIDSLSSVERVNTSRSLFLEKFFTISSITSFFNTYRNFWRYYNKIFDCCKPTGMDWVNIRGAYQQVKALDCVWPMYSIVSFEEIEEFYSKNYDEKKKKVIIPEKYTKNDPKSENIFDDLLIGIDEELVEEVA